MYLGCVHQGIDNRVADRARRRAGAARHRRAPRLRPSAGLRRGQPRPQRGSDAAPAPDEPDLAALCERAAEAFNGTYAPTTPPVLLQGIGALNVLLRALAAHHRAEAARRQRQGEAWKAVAESAEWATKAANGPPSYTAWRALADLAREMGK